MSEQKLYFSRLPDPFSWEECGFEFVSAEEAQRCAVLINDLLSEAHLRGKEQGAAEQREKDEALLRETGEHLVRLGHVQAGQQIIATCDLWKFNDAEAIRTQGTEQSDGHTGEEGVNDAEI